MKISKEWVHGRAKIMFDQELTDELVDFSFPFPCLFCAALYALRYVYTLLSQEATIIPPLSKGSNTSFSKGRMT